MGLWKKGKNCSRTRSCSLNGRAIKKPFKWTSYRNFAKRINNGASLLRPVIKSLTRHATLQLPDGTQQIDFPTGTRIMSKTSEIPLMPDAVEAYSDPDRMPLKIHNHNYQSCPVFFSALRKCPSDEAAIASELADGVWQPVRPEIPDGNISNNTPKPAFLPSRRRTWSAEAERVAKQVNLPSWAKIEDVDEVPFCEMRLKETVELEQKDINARKKWVLDFIPGSQRPAELPNWAKAKSSQFVRSVKPAVRKDGIGLFGAAHPPSAIKPFRASPVPATTYKASLPVRMKRHQLASNERVKADMIAQMLESKTFPGQSTPQHFQTLSADKRAVIGDEEPPLPSR
ncbi:hypothetical protein GHT06_014073 [Daphnia sinensis]|uniref:Uncharacterized protein n=1 Tax=Daphnia sinensis TaxID=1820382 RepID=A0AAD5LD67_9CRUS|nr:hypothetical protein GHT06_014073 [Daphnia sinensis]